MPVPGRALRPQAIGEEARKRDAARGAGVSAIPQPPRGKRFFGEHATAAGKPEQPQVGRRSRKRGDGFISELGGEPGARPFEAPDRLVEADTGRAERGIVGAAHGGDDATQLSDEGRKRLPARQRQLAGDEVDRLDAVRPLVDLRHARVTVELSDARLLDEPHAAMHLDSEGSDFAADLGGKCLGDGRQQRGPRIRGLARGGIAPNAGQVDRHGGRIADRARRVGQRTHAEQHPLHVGVLDDGCRVVPRLAGDMPLPPLARISERMLGGGLGDRDPLEADRKPRPVHHGEHAGDAVVLLAHEVADRSALVAEHHGAGRRGMNAELVLDRLRAHVVALAERAVGVDQSLRHDKHRQAFGAGRRVRQAREHHVNDVVGEVVLAERDEDLLTGKAVGAIAGGDGFGAQRADIRARLRLGEMHGAHPLAGHELWQIGRLQLRRGMRGDQLDRRHGEQRAEPEGHRRPAPDLDQRRVERIRQALAAPFGGSGQPVPTGRRPIAIGVFPSGGHRHRAVLERRTVRVADAVERRDHSVGEFPRFLGDRRDQIVAEVAKKALAARRLQPSDVIEREQDIGDRGGIRHEPSLGN